ncbi:hypothetical protein RHIZO_05237 [Rhizobiaceae bacterium]|nr:hypothetical protein RHIZO_05237 [Rhizobiaceae bacterium]
MIRLVILTALVVVAWLLILQAVRLAKVSTIDWKGLAVAAGFVALAFYLRHVTGMG